MLFELLILIIPAARGSSYLTPFERSASTYDFAERERNVVSIVVFIHFLSTKKSSSFELDFHFFTLSPILFLDKPHHLCTHLQ